MALLARVSRTATIVVAAAGFLTGCGSDGRVAVSGSVTLKGQPLSNATIQFIPLDGESPAGGAVVADGRYELPARPGLPPGTYRVSISSPAGGTRGGSLTAGPAARPDSGRPPAGDLVPAKYNTETQLRADVTARGPNTFDFDLR